MASENQHKNINDRLIAIKFTTACICWYLFYTKQVLQSLIYMRVIVINPVLIQLLVYFSADRGKDKSQGTTKPVNKANSAAAKVTTSNGNGALNR